ncbi:MAG: glycosyl hydrolase [Bacteroidia bacterium]|nr:glycosyl hydrolase [Bacteroidia bacterium]
MTQKLLLTTLIIAFLFQNSLFSQKKNKKDDTPETPTEEKDIFSSSTFSGLKFRSVGPALTSGRIADFAVNPKNRAEYYVAVASGGVWKTVNAGTTYEPIFDGEGSYSIGCVTLDPSNPHTVWVGTGENNAQRSVAYGDGVYKSTDGGKSWKNMGLKESEHIGRIVVDPRNSDVVFVAAHGPLWRSGGDRGLYKTTDGGKNWKKVFETDENTGVNEVIMDPRNPDVLYASAWQRTRRVWTFISGGPGSALYKSTDGGETWEKSQTGLPGGDLGRIGLAISPVNPDVIYAILDAEGGKGGVFRSTNRGVTWEKRGDLVTSGNYYQEIFCDPVNVDRVYAMDMLNMVSDDGGKTWNRLGEENKHVDNHALWIDPNFPNYYLSGCDGGIYESFDRGQNWHYKANLPITQFYKVSVDQTEPFYLIYGGTQDNYSLGGPSRNTSPSGILNSDWFVTNGGDGFETQIDPKDPNIVYAQSQYGGLVRFDKKSGEDIFIKPMEGKGEPGLRWNWDAPLLISPHKNTRLYFAANKLFKSEDRGDNWTAISGDLSRQLDRNSLPVMGKVWGVDAVEKNVSTSIYGNIVALDESPKKEGLIYVGTDDGLIHVSENTGGSWRKVETFPGVPERTYVNMIVTSLYDENTVYAAFNNHKNGDFKPYILKSSDKGQNWTNIAANLPERGSVYSIAEDHVDPQLLFVGTEFGVFFTRDGGQKWIQLKGGLPTIAVRDIAIQRRENDLVLGTFGRGFYVLDDYSCLRNLSEETFKKEANIFPIKDALLFVEYSPLGGRGKSFQGASLYTADNPPVGAVFTYFLKDSPKTLKQIRKDREKEAEKAGESVKYPTFEEMRAEDNEEAAYTLFTITDENGEIVNRIKGGTSKGLSRTVWNFRYASTSPVQVGGGRGGQGGGGFGSGGGHLALPGKYFVSMAISVNGQVKELIDKQPFVVKPLNNLSLPASDQEASLAFQKDVAELYRIIRGATNLHTELTEKTKSILETCRVYPQVPLAVLSEAKEVELQLLNISRALNGDASVEKRQFETPPAISDRIQRALFGLYSARTAPTGTMREQYQIAKEEFEPVKNQLKEIVEKIKTIESRLEQVKAPYTPGRTDVLGN